MLYSSLLSTHCRLFDHILYHTLANISPSQSSQSRSILTPLAGQSVSQFTTPNLIMHAASMGQNDLEFWSIPSSQRLGRTPSRQRKIAERMQDPAFRRRVEQAKETLINVKLSTWRDEIIRERLMAYKEDLADWLGGILDTHIAVNEFMHEICE